jgi:hypothetical protein
VAQNLLRHRNPRCRSRSQAIAAARAMLGSPPVRLVRALLFDEPIH